MPKQGMLVCAAESAGGLDAAPYPCSSIEDQFGRLQVAASAPSLDLLTGDGLPGQQMRQGSSSSYAGLPSWATEESSGASFRLPAASQAARNKHAIMVRRST